MRAFVSKWQIFQDTRLTLCREICELVIVDLVVVVLHPVRCTYRFPRS